MATHAIGKLKFNLSKQGLAYRWGDGEIHRLFNGKKSATGDEDIENLDPNAEEGYSDAYDAENDGYDADFDGDKAYDDDYADDGYADGDDYADDDYDDGKYADGEYDDDGAYDDGKYADDGRYDDEDYDDDGYADERYDDEYDDADYDDDGRYGDGDGYDEGGYDDGDGYDDEAYDDRYSDEDADDYEGEGGEYAEQSLLMRYVDENDWVTYLLLFLFPPLGIYLLWRRNRFEKPIRWAITAASAIWFVVALILLLHGLFGGSGDKQAQSSITIPPLSTQTVAPVSTPDAGDKAGDVSGDTSDEPIGDGTEVTPAPTALAGSVSGTSDSGNSNANYVYSPSTGLYYHSTETCSNIDEGASLSRVVVDIAINSRHQSACPVCIGGGTVTTYYATSGGKYYHLDASCSKMQNPQVYTREAAENEGKEPCPVCVTKTKKTLDEDENDNTVFIKSSTNDKSGIQVYATKGGEHFHVKSDCSGMSGASRGSLKDALLMGKTACPVCCASAGTKVYCTEGGKSYHIDPNCQHMKDAKQVTLAEAMVMGKTACDVCLKDGIEEAASSSGTLNTTTEDGEVSVYATKDGKYYHTDKTCSGMKGAQKVSLKSMLLAKRAACPKCAASANTQVYATPGGKYYHSYATCSDMKNANSGTLAQALAAGYKRCPKCWGSKSSSSKSSSTDGAQSVSVKASAARSTATAGNTYVYATREGTYYHIDNGCSGMKGASRITLRTAIKAGKKACPVCASAANRTVYSTKNGDHYHAASTCEASGMKNGTKRTLAEALMMNQTACQYCMGRASSASSSSSATESAQSASAETSTASTPTSSGIFTSGKSGIRVYATASGRYYHTDRNCGGMSNAARVTLETALNYGKRACPVCAASAERTVYATRGGRYYHYSKSDAGSGAQRGTLAAALAFGFDPCPKCVQHQNDADDEVYSSGTSGIKVYATPSSKYYHSKANCSGLSGASRISLETALNYGKTACPVCLSAANKKVYASKGSRYYHLYRAHAGSSAKAGTLAAALAYGLKLCPTCSAAMTIGSGSPDNGGSSSAPVSTQEYSAPSDTGVYIDIGSANNYYHKSSSCRKADFSGGMKVTLQYVCDWGYKPCPYCNPPTDAYEVPDDSSDT